MQRPCTTGRGASAILEGGDFTDKQIHYLAAMVSRGGGNDGGIVVKIITLFLAMLVALSPLLTYANSYEITGGTLTGEGLDELRIEGEPDEHGLVWMLNSPRRAHDPWLAWVYNDSDSPVFGVEVSLYLYMGDNWYLPGTDAANAMVWPYQIDPGGVGIVDLGSVSVRQRAWSDEEIRITNIDQEHVKWWSVFEIEDFEGDNNNISLTMINNGNEPLSQVGVRVACVDQGELTGIDYELTDLIALYPGESEKFEFGSDIECDDDGWIYTPLSSTTG